MSEYIYRDATIADIPFLVDVIIEAEKSGSNTIGLANIFGIDEYDLRNYLRLMLEEEIDGCEFSVSSFIIAEYEGLPVAGYGGWIEEENEDNLPSFMLKANLFSYILPREKILKLNEISEIIKGFLFAREPHTLHIEYLYVKPEHRGKGIPVILYQKLIERAKRQNKFVKKSYVQGFEQNIASIKAAQKAGYKIVKRIESKNPKILNYFPYNVILLSEKEI